MCFDIKKNILSSNEMSEWSSLYLRSKALFFSLRCDKRCLTA